MILIIRSKVDLDTLILDLRKRKYQFHIEPFMYFKRLYPKISLDPNGHYIRPYDTAICPSGLPLTYPCIGNSCVLRAL